MVGILPFLPSGPRDLESRQRDARREPRQAPDLVLPDVPLRRLGELLASETALLRDADVLFDPLLAPGCGRLELHGRGLLAQPAPPGGAELEPGDRRGLGDLDAGGELPAEVRVVDVPAALRVERVLEVSDPVLALPLAPRPLLAGEGRRNPFLDDPVLLEPGVSLVPLDAERREAG